MKNKLEFNRAYDYAFDSSQKEKVLELLSQIPLDIIAIDERLNPDLIYYPSFIIGFNRIRSRNMKTGLRLNPRYLFHSFKISSPLIEDITSNNYILENDPRYCLGNGRYNPFISFNSGEQKPKKYKFHLGIAAFTLIDYQGNPLFPELVQ